MRPALEVVPRVSRKTSASSTSRIASHLLARLKSFSRLRSARDAFNPISATLTMKRGFPVASAIVSAVSVFPTPGGPISCQKSVRER